MVLLSTSPLYMKKELNMDPCLNCVNFKFNSFELYKCTTRQYIIIIIHGIFVTNTLILIVCDKSNEKFTRQCW